jgi:hypothetical protein
VVECPTIADRYSRPTFPAYCRPGIGARVSRKDTGVGVFRVGIGLTAATGGAPIEVGRGFTRLNPASRKVDKKGIPLSSIRGRRGDPRPRRGEV